MATLLATDIPVDTCSPAEHLRQIAVAVRVSFTWWGVHRCLTNEQKEEASATYAADARFLTAGKKIIDVKHEAYRELTSLRSKIVSYWRSLTLPYVEAGVRLIRQAEVRAFVNQMERSQGQLIQAEANLNAAFAQVKTDARRRLGRLYNPQDYPAEIRGLFGVEWDFPATEPPNYLLRISPEIYAQEQERVTRRFEQAVELAEQAFVTEFSRLVSHLTERLGSGEEGERKIFRDTVVTNLGEFFERFRNLSVRSNTQLDQLVDQAKNLVQGIEPQALRDNNALRQ